MKLLQRLRQPIPLPNWAIPPVWLRQVGRGVWCAGFCVIATLVLARIFPPPWNAVMLTLLGISVLFRPKLYMEWFVLEGRSAVLIGIVFLVAGIVLWGRYAAA